MKYVTAEIDALEQLQDDNIIKVLDLCEDEQNICVVMELIAGGNLSMLFIERFKEKDPLREDETASIVYQILKALKYLHEREKPMAHRDLKPDNILVDVIDGQIICKLTDFGLAFEEDQDKVTRDAAGTKTFMSPEQITGQSQDVKVDIWSLGILAYILLVNAYPFREGRMMEENIKNQTLMFDRKIEIAAFSKLMKNGEPAKDFISKCTQKRAQDRPTAE